MIPCVRRHGNATPSDTDAVAAHGSRTSNDSPICAKRYVRWKTGGRAIAGYDHVQRQPDPNKER